MSAIFNDIDVRLEDEAVFVRHRVVGVVLFKQWCLALDNALHLNPDRALLVRHRLIELGGKDWPPGVVSIFHTGADAVRVGHVAGNRVEPHRLCAHSRACYVEDLEQTHHCSPFRAFSRPLILLFINSREV